MYYEAAWRSSFRSVIHALVEENVRYAEIRLDLHHGSHVVSDDGQVQLTHRRMLQILYDTLQTEKTCLERSGVVFYGVRVIFAALRNSERTEMQSCIDDCIELKIAFPDFLCGRYISVSASLENVLTFCCSKVLICADKKMLASRCLTGSRSFFVCAHVVMKSE